MIRFAQKPTPDQQARLRSAVNRRLVGFEYRTNAALFGYPLVHICRGGLDAPGSAKGIIAIGDVAFGLIAIGGVAVGLVSFGAVAFGLLTFGAVAIGAFSFGGCAIGYWAGGAVAIGIYANAAVAVGLHTLGVITLSPDGIKLPAIP